MVETGSKDEDTDSGLVFNRQRVDDVMAPSYSASGGHAPSFRDNPPSASSPRDLIVHEGEGRVLLKATKRLLSPIFQPFSNKHLGVSRIKR